MTTKKRVITALLVVGILFSSVLVMAEDTQSGLQDIIDRALKENMDLELAKLSLEEARINYKKSNLQNLMTNSKLEELKAELQMVKAEDNYRAQKNGIIIDITGDYLEIIKLDKQIETNEKEVQLEESKVEKVKAELEVGYKGDLELFEQQTTYQDKVDTLETNRDSKQQKTKILKQNAGIGEENVGIKIYSLTRPQEWDITEQEAVETALASSTVIVNREKQIEVAESDLDRAKISGAPELDIRQKELALKRAKLNLIKEKQNIENEVQSSFFQYKQAVKNMNIAEKRMIQAKDQYEIIREQYQAGLVSKNDLLTADANSMKAGEGFNTAIINYYIAKLNLQDSMGMKLEVNIASEADDA